jgi:hypothetical protein
LPDLTPCAALSLPRSALFGWTGNTQLNRAVKRFANNLGYEMTDLTLVPTATVRDSAVDKKGGESGHWTTQKEEHLHQVRGTELESEFDIWSFYGLRYISPEDRNVLAVVDESGDARQQSNKAPLEGVVGRLDGRRARNAVGAEGAANSDDESDDEREAEAQFGALTPGASIASSGASPAPRLAKAARRGGLGP